MNRFDFSIPTKILFGAGRLDDIGQLVMSESANRKILVFSGNHCHSSGLTDRIISSLRQANCRSFVSIEVGVHPDADSIDNLVSRYANDEIELIIALGGGSVIDTAKAFSAAYSERSEIWNLVEGKQKIEKAVGIIAIPTNPASGSESNGSSVITNSHIRIKRGLSSSFLIPKFAILDPELTCTLSEKETVRSATDIMFHSIERFLCTDNTDSTITDMVSISVIKNVIALVPVILNDPNDLNARGEMMWCGNLSNCGLTGLGRAVEFPIHQLGHQISACFNVPHADSLTSVWKAWGDYAKENHYKRIAKLGSDVFGGERYKGETDIASATIRELNDLWERWGMPTSLGACCNELSDEDIKVLINSITNNGKRIIGKFWHINHDDVRRIIERAL